MNSNHSITEKQAEVKATLDSALAELAAQLQQGKSERLVEFLTFSAKFHRYSMSNQMLIFIQRPTATRVAGYQRWQEMKRQVRHGEKGIAIFAPIMYRQGETMHDDGTTEPIVGVRGFRVAYVFDVAQTDGEALPEFWTPLADDAEDVYSIVKAAVETAGIAIEETDLPGSVQGVSKGGRIILERNRDSRSRTLTLVHEWAHEVVHRTWMAIEELKATAVQSRECVAEAVSFAVARWLGIENPFSADYLLAYQVGADLLVKELDVIRKAADHIIGQIEQQQAA